MLAAIETGRKSKIPPDRWVVLVVSTLGILAGSAILIMAPGNYARLHSSGQSLQFDAVQIVRNFKGIVLDYEYMIRILALVIPFCGLLLAFVVAGEQRHLHFFKTISVTISRTLIVRFLDKAKWLILAVLTIVPFAAIQGFHGPRTAIFFMTYLIIFLLEFFVPIFVGLLFAAPYENISAKRHIHPTGKKLILLLFVVQCGVMAIHYGIGGYAKYQLIGRDRLLHSPQNRDKDVELSQISVPFFPFALSFDDFSTDSTDWRNCAAAQYYHVRSIRLRAPDAH
jgi:hypothetical protein